MSATIYEYFRMCNEKIRIFQKISYFFLCLLFLTEERVKRPSTVILPERPQRIFVGLITTRFFLFGADWILGFEVEDCKFAVVLLGGVAVGLSGGDFILKKACVFGSSIIN